MNRLQHPAFRVLFGSIVGVGLVILGVALYRVISDHTPYPWLVLAALTLFAGSFSLKIPGVNGRVTAGDTLTCVSLLLFGPFPGAVIAALEGIGGSIRCKTVSRRFEFILFNACAMALTAFIAGQAVFALLGKPPLYHQPSVPIPLLVGPILVLAAAYFSINTILVAATVALEKSANIFSTWRESFLWTCVNYLSGASVAGLLVQISDPLAPIVLATTLAGCLTVYVSSNAHVLLERKQQLAAQLDCLQQDHHTRAIVPSRLSNSPLGPAEE